MRIGMIICLLAIGMSTRATNYYVDPVGGSDSNTGLATDKAWKTLLKIKNTVFAPGDNILLIRGGVWRETLTVPSSGTASQYIHFASYGSGAKPKILGSVKGTWTASGTNVWILDLTCTNPYGNGFTSEIFFEEKNGTVIRGVHKTSTSALTTEHDWTWVSNRIYVYSTVDPDIQYNSVEVPQRGTIIEPNNKQYLHFNGIDLFYSLSEGFGDGSYPNQNVSGLIIENSEIAYHGSMAAEIGYGITAVYSRSIIRGNKVHDCGRRSISLNPYASGFTVKNVVITGNELYNGSHTTGIDMSIGSGSFNVSLDSIVISNNLIYDDQNSNLTSELLFAQNYNAGGTFTNLYIYGNIFKYPTISSVHLENVQSAYVYNNTFYGHNKVKTSNTYHVFVDAGSTNVKIKNNIFYTDLSYDSGGTGIAIYESGSQDHRQIDADYNLYYRLTNNLRIILANNGNYYMNTIASVRTALGWETHSPAPQNPLFISATDLHLQTASAGAGAGLNIPEVTRDFSGELFGTPRNIGCYAGNSTAPIPVYVSSCVEDVTPGIVDILFSLSLINTVPAPAAFTFQVNGSPRPCNSVTVVGGTVKLGLAIPLKNTDIVAVTYTKPPISPLQTAAGGQVATFTLKSVTNNIKSGSTAINDYSAMSNIVLYPNPATRYFNISFNGEDLSPRIIRVFSGSGVLVSETAVESGSNSIQVPIRFGSGIYLVQIVSDKGKIVGIQKLVVNN